MTENKPLVELTKNELKNLYPDLNLKSSMDKASMIMAIEIHRLYLTLFPGSMEIIKPVP